MMRRFFAAQKGEAMSSSRKQQLDLSGWFSGKTVLLTGATSGIGREMAKILAKNGSKLILCGRDEGAMQSLKAELVAYSSQILDEYLVDLQNLTAVRDLCGCVRNHYEVDILVNNAGFGFMSDFADMSSAKIEEMMAVNVNAVVLLCQEFVEVLKQKPGRGILNVGSVASFFPTPHSSLYGATKHFILGLTDALHAELLSSGVHVTGVYPGKTLTRFIERASGGKTRQWDAALSPETVALEGLRGLSLNRVRVIPGLANQIKVMIARLLPVEILLRQTGARSPK